MKHQQGFIMHDVLWELVLLVKINPSICSMFSKKFQKISWQHLLHLRASRLRKYTCDKGKCSDQHYLHSLASIVWIGVLTVRLRMDLVFALSMWWDL